MTSFLELTVCDHRDQEFYSLGRIQLEVPAEVALDALSANKPHDCDTADTCFVVDYWPNESVGISDDREVTAEIADQLLAGELHTRWEAAREALQDYYAGDAPDHDPFPHPSEARS